MSKILNARVFFNIIQYENHRLISVRGAGTLEKPVLRKLLHGTTFELSVGFRVLRHIVRCVWSNGEPGSWGFSK